MDKLVEELAKIATQQAKLINEITTKVFKQGANNTLDSSSAVQSSTEYSLEVLARNIQEFHLELDNGVTFEKWYVRYADLFENDASKLDDAAKVRLLMRKLGPQEHNRYCNFILPKQPKDYNFDQTITKLKNIFGTRESLFRMRCRCLQLKKSDVEDYITFASEVNKQCENFELGKLSTDQFKCLMFVIGLQSSAEADVRTRLLTLLEKENDLNLDKLIAECHRISSLKQDTQLVEASSSAPSFSINAVNHKHKEGTIKDSHNSHSESIHAPKTPCWGCGGMHFSKYCKYREHTCNQCHRQGHKEGYCSCFSTTKPDKRQRQPGTKDKRNKTRCHNYSQSVRHKKVKFTQLRVNRVVSASRKHITLKINNVTVALQVDTASDITIIAVKTWKKLNQPKLQLDKSVVTDAQGNQMPMLGFFYCTVTFVNKKCTAKCFVTRNSLNLIGIDLIERLGLWDIPLNMVCNQINEKPLIESIKSEFPIIFEETLGCCNRTKLQLFLKEKFIPVYKQKRPVPYATATAIEQELQRLEAAGIISPIDFSEWAAPIVAVRKPNGQIRICPDYSTGLNASLQPHLYPLPRPEDIFIKHANSKFFTNIDLSDAYLQIQVDDSSKHLLTMNTHKGLYQWNRLPPGIKTGPGFFQQLMDTMLSGLENVSAYIDDLLISGRDRKQHDQCLRAVLTRLAEFGFKIKINKCNFLMTEIHYLGHILNNKGTKPDPQKTEAIRDMPAPQNLHQLRSFLGAINYYGKYIPKMSQLRAPLDQLLKKGAKWSWSSDCKKAFQEFKRILQSDLALTHFNPSLLIIVSADASKEGIGACLSHRFPDGKIKAVYHISRTLTPAEKNYSQIEKEALALVFAVTRFHRMLLGRKFLLETDHKPLLAVLQPKKGIPVHSANRLQRWALTLQAYDFDIKFVPTQEFGNADILSRLIGTRKIDLNEDYIVAQLSMQQNSDFSPELHNNIQNLPVTHNMIKLATNQSRELCKMKQFITTGWPKDIPAELRPYYNRKDSLMIVEDCLLLNQRVIIPKGLRQRVFKQLHKGHPGEERMKSLARSYVYWPGIDDEIKLFVKQCNKCQLAANSPTKVTLASWPLCNKPWQRIHIDYAGPVNNTWFLIVVDAYSKWPEVIATQSTTSTTTVKLLEQIFSRFGYPQLLVSDNGTQFTSSTFRQFCLNHGIDHIKTAPYHPQSNGQAERVVGTFKNALKKLEGEGTIAEIINTFLLSYRSTPSRTLQGKSPAEKMLGRSIRTTLDLLKPTSPSRLNVNTSQNALFNKRHNAKPKAFKTGDLVFVKQYSGTKPFWTAGEIIERVGRVNYNVLIRKPRKLVRAHANQLRHRFSSAETSDYQLPLKYLLEEFELTPYSEPKSTPDTPVDVSAEGTLTEEEGNYTDLPATTDLSQCQLPAAKPARSRRPPQRFSPTDFA